MIPKTMAFFWGNDQMSWLRYMTLYSFCKFNPDWDVRLYCCPSNNAKQEWTDQIRQDFSQEVIEDYSPRIANLPITLIPWELEYPGTADWQSIGPSHKSNFFKWDWLSSNAGFYADMDILFVRSLDNLLAEVQNSNIVICHTDPRLNFPSGYFSIGLLASSGDCIFYRDVLAKAFETYDPTGYQCVGVESLYRTLHPQGNSCYAKGPLVNFYEHLLRKYPNLNVYNLDMSVVYPFLYNVASQHFFDEYHTDVPNNTVGIHWYAGAPNSHLYNRFLTESNYGKCHNTLKYFVDRIVNNG